MIIPKPSQIETHPGFFTITANTEIVSDEASRSSARFLAAAFTPATGFDFRLQDTASAPAIHIALDPSLVHLGPEGYRLEVSPHRIEIRASAGAGQHYAIQTLRQQLPVEIFSETKVQGVEWNVGAGVIEDSPRFGWRGLMLDVSRHLFSVAEIKRFIDTMALHKLNVLHWHLVDDQGWRLEIKRYPMLTEVGGRRAESPRRGDRRNGDGIPYGGFYTQEEVREIVRYATERFITVVPEIEMPGHAAAAIAAYPHLGNSDIPSYEPEVKTRWGIHSYIFSPREETFEFVQNVLLEVMDLFPSKYIHVGGDEAPKEQWKNSPSAQAIMKEYGIADEDGLQSWFLRRIEKFLQTNGRKLIGWDEIQEGGLSPDATMMVWRDWKWALHALNSGNNVVMSPQTHCYFDHYQGSPETEPEAIHCYLPLEQVYTFEPLPPGSPAGHEKLILGGQANLWAEYIHDSAHLEYMAYPRACALAEALWSYADARNWAEFLQRLQHHTKRLTLLKVNFRPLAASLK